MRQSIRRASLPVLLVGLMSCGGSDDPTEPDPPRATSMALSQSTVELSFLGQSVVLTAAVVDQFGGPFSATVTWSSVDESVATVGTSGQVTAIGNGMTTVTARFESLSASASVTVQQVATRVSAVSGFAQTGTVGEALAEPLVVRSEDAGGAPVPGASVTFTVGEGGGAVSVAEATTDGEGLVSTSWTLGTAAGQQRVDAAITGSTSGGVSFAATALAGPATDLPKTSGDQQIGTVGFALSQPVTVTLTDAFGNGVAGGAVSFTVTGGGGSVTPSQTTAGEDGTAQAIWTMGTSLGANTLSAASPGLPVVDFTATAEAARADLQPGALVIDPENPTALQAFDVSTTVTNVGYLSTGTGFEVQLLVDGVEAGTTVLPALAVGGTADATFSVGPLAVGSHVLGVVVDAGGAVDESNEANNTAQHAADIPFTTLVTAGVAITGISGATETEQLFTMEVPASPSGTMVVTLSGGTGDVDLYVHHGDRPASRDDYHCQSGSPETDESCVFNDAEPGTYHILLFAFSAFSGTSLLGTTGGPEVPYDIELSFIHRGSASQDAAFEEAAATWMSILKDDIAPIDFTSFPVPANTCMPGQPIIDDAIDDLRIYVDIVELDGQGGGLARGGPCFIHGLSQLPVVGIMQFDVEDIDGVESAGDLLTIVLHEMGHVLGFGTIWDSPTSDRFRRLQNPSLPNNTGADTHFDGPRAIAAFDVAGGSSTYTLGEKVPVENEAGAGSADSHWRESVLGQELLTPFIISGGRNPLSAITIESLADVGYRVDVSQAEPFGKVYSAPFRIPAKETLIDLRGDLRRGPIYTIDRDGRIREVVRR